MENIDILHPKMIDGKIDNRLEVLKLLKDPNQDAALALYNKYENDDWIIGYEDGRPKPYYSSTDVTLMTFEREDYIAFLEEILDVHDLDFKRKLEDETLIKTLKKHKTFEQTHITDYFVRQKNPEHFNFTFESKTLSTLSKNDLTTEKSTLNSSYEDEDALSLQTKSTILVDNITTETLDSYHPARPQLEEKNRDNDHFSR